MENNIYIPKKIKVGYQERNDTYSKKLAYVTYYDEKNVLRKEKSWEGWRDKDIAPNDFDNEPKSGFVLNKKAGGERCSWNPRQTYVRVYDPRGFEIEITIPNLLYILENTNSIKGKGLEGEFVYAFSGKELVLVPTSSPDYVKMMELAKCISAGSYIAPKDLVLGYTYLTKSNEKLVYLGEYEVYGRNKVVYGKRYMFANEHSGIIYYSSVKERFIKIINNSVHMDFDELVGKLSIKNVFLGDVYGVVTNKSKGLKEFYTLAQFKKEVNSNSKEFKVLSYDYYSDLEEYKIQKNLNGTINVFKKTNKIRTGMTVEEFVKDYKPVRERK